jgi:hypothetical protein
VKTYRRSALASALIRMWRGWSVIVPVVIVNALLQALLVWPDFELDQSWLNLTSAVLSAAVFVVAFGLVAATALRVPDGRVEWGTAAATLGRSAVRYGLWALGLLASFAAALVLSEALALLVLGITPFLLLAALDGETNPLGANFRTIGRRFWRWLVTVLIVGGVVVLGTVLTGVTAFFIRGSAASLLVWIVAGLVLSWFTTAWALIYRDANAAHDDPDPTDESDPAAASVADTD